MAQKVEVQIIGEDKLSGVLGGIKSSLTGLGQIAASVALGGVALLGTAVVGLGVFLKQSVDSAMEAQEVLAQLDAVLASTGGAAGVTRDQVLSLADSLQATTKFSDETIVSGENMLLTFTSIGKDVFPLATKTMLDMSQALGQDVKNSAIQLGKALNDPIKGVTALRKVGVQFTDEQEKMIKKLVESGDLMGAQNLILKELQVEFGGSAEAAGKTFAGQLEILKNQFDEVKESVGMAVIPVLQMLIERVVIPALPLIQKFADYIIGLAEAFADTGDIFSSEFLESLTAFMPQDMQDKFFEIANIVREVFNGIVTFVSGIDIGAIFAGIAEAAQPFIQFLQTMQLWWAVNGPPIMAAVSEMGASFVGTFQQIAAEVGPFIGNVLARLGAWFAENGPLIQSYVQKIADVWTMVLMPAILVAWNTISPILSGLVDVILGLVTFVMQVGTGDWAGAWETIKQVVVDAGTAILTGITNFVNGILGYFDMNLQGIIDTWRNIFEMLPDVLRVVVPQIYSAVTEMGTRVVEGIKAGIQAGWEGLKSWFMGMVRALLNSAKSVLGIRSPSTEFALVGRQIMAGLGQGIGDGVTIPVNAMNTSMSQLLGTAATPGGAVGVPPALTGTGGGPTVVLQIQSPVTVMDEKMTQGALMKYIEFGVRELQTKGVL